MYNKMYIYDVQTPVYSDRIQYTIFYRNAYDCKIMTYSCAIMSGF